MKTNATSTRPNRFGWLISAALTTTLAIGCAATEDDAAEETPQQASSESLAAGASDLDTDKAPKRDFCCAVKSGNYTENCVDMHVRKARGVLACSFGDNVLRDGRCWQYDDCEPYVYIP